MESYYRHKPVRPGGDASDMTANNAINTDSEKRRSVVAPFFTAG